MLQEWPFAKLESKEGTTAHTLPACDDIAVAPSKGEEEELDGNDTSTSGGNSGGKDTSNPSDDRVDSI